MGRVRRHRAAGRALPPGGLEHEEPVEGLVVVGLDERRRATELPGEDAAGPGVLAAGAAVEVPGDVVVLGPADHGGALLDAVDERARAEGAQRRRERPVGDRLEDDGPAAAPERRGAREGDGDHVGRVPVDERRPEERVRVVPRPRARHEQVGELHPADERDAREPAVAVAHHEQVDGVAPGEVQRGGAQVLREPEGVVLPRPLGERGPGAQVRRPEVGQSQPLRRRGAHEGAPVVPGAAARMRSAIPSSAGPIARSIQSCRL
ncbi:unannotated protein [freshwater metagenome]|uniref:Unannotated protein n=1 Tax=freshwater metagenome TaxID=449393 RepID=A0A6J7HJA1_9ZZZZ